MKKFKIAIIGSRGYPYVYSGYETLVKELSERLVKKGHIVRVYCHRFLFKNRPKNINGIELIYTPSIKSKALSQLYNSFFSFLHVCFSDTDVVFVVNSANGPFGILTKLFRKKTCINVDGLEWLRPKWKGLGSLYFKVASKLATIFFDEIITDSDEMNKIYIDKFGRDSSVIAYGSTMCKYSNTKFLTKLNLIKNQYYLIVGRLIPDNNSKLIIEAFLKIKSDKKLVIVGDVPYNDSYSSSIKKIKSKRLILTGYVRCQIELSQLYDNCFAYIHGHEYGGTNPTMINALALNSKIISIKTKFTLEMLQNKEVIYFEKNNKSISKSFKIFEKNYDKLKRLNKDYKIPLNYKWFYISNKYENLFYKLLFDKIS